MRVLVCGGREYADRRYLDYALCHFHSRLVIDRLIHGAAKGADTLAMEWAVSRGVQCVAYPADWQRHGRRAGPIRNAEMLASESPDVVIAFPGGAGTAHMVAIAREAGVTVYELGRQA